MNILLACVEHFSSAIMRDLRGEMSRRIVITAKPRIDISLWKCEIKPYVDIGVFADRKLLEEAISKLDLTDLASCLEQMLREEVLRYLRETGVVELRSEQTLAIDVSPSGEEPLIVIRAGDRHVLSLLTSHEESRSAQMCHVLASTYLRLRLHTCGIKCEPACVVSAYIIRELSRLGLVPNRYVLTALHVEQSTVRKYVPIMLYKTSDYEDYEVEEHVVDYLCISLRTLRVDGLDMLEQKLRELTEEAVSRAVEKLREHGLELRVDKSRLRLVVLEHSAQVHVENSGIALVLDAEILSRIRAGLGQLLEELYRLDMLAEATREVVDVVVEVLDRLVNAEEICVRLLKPEVTAV